MDTKKLLNYVLFFLSLSLILQLFFAKPTEAPQADNNRPTIEFQTTKDSYKENKTVGLKITNNSADTLVIKNSCPNEPFNISYLSNGETISKTQTATLDCETEADPAAKDLTILSGKTKTLNYTFWSNSLFSDLGQYKITANLKVKDETVHVESNIFQIKERGFIGRSWTSAFYQPIYNFFILLLSFIPGHNLGIAIILLTLILRGILFIPSQKAIQSQKKMADIQPKLNAVKEKYKDNQQMIASETMKIWKENNVSPASSCLPMLIQFPILISLFYVIKNVLNPDKTYLLYDYLKDFDFTQIQTLFLGFNLKFRSAYILPVIVGGLQFFQLRQMQAKKPEQPKKEKKKKEDGAPDPQDMQNMMQYFMPVMIAVFTSSMPAGVGLYWGTSTFFSILQQTFTKTDDSKNPPKRKEKKPKRQKINPKKVTTIKI